jgi:response regulator of citrate/malate metabolism
MTKSEAFEYEINQLITTLNNDIIMLDFYIDKNNAMALGCQKWKDAILDVVSILKESLC